jgi:hypothetical protein
MILTLYNDDYYYYYHVIDEASFVKNASNSWQAEVIVRSTSYQTP